jgi:hypothetical protein
MMVEYLATNLTLTKLTDYLNESEQFKKQSGKPFTTNDCFQYVKLGHLPYYMGGNKIDESETEINGINLYSLRRQ